MKAGCFMEGAIIKAGFLPKFPVVEAHNIQKFCAYKISFAMESVNITIVTRRCEIGASFDSGISEDGKSFELGIFEGSGTFELGAIESSKFFESCILEADADLAIELGVFEASPHVELRILEVSGYGVKSCIFEVSLHSK